MVFGLFFIWQKLVISGIIKIINIICYLSFVSKKNKILNNYFGFTLVELLTSIVIIGIVSTVFIVNYRSSEEKSKIKMITQKAASDIRLAQSYSLASNEFNGSFPAGGWGVHFDVSAPNSYIIFADQDGDRAYDADEKFKEVFLFGIVRLDSLSIAGNLADIVFLPPAPTTYINGAENSEAKIYFIDKNNIKKSIQVNFLGLIDVID